MFCSNCGGRKESGEDFWRKCDESKPKKKKKSGWKIIIVTLVLLSIIGLGVVGTLFVINTNKKLNIEIDNVVVEKYPTISVNLKKIGEKSTFKKSNIILYEDGKEIEDYTITSVENGWSVKYTTDEASEEMLEKKIKIKNKHDDEDLVETKYQKPKQEKIEMKISQVDSNNFPEVDVYFTAMDSIGNNIKDFDISNLNLMGKDKSGADVKKEIKNISFIDKKEPVSINMVMETSGSMNSQMNLCKDMAVQFINNIDFTMGDKVEIIEFNDTSNVNNYFTSNRESLINSINGLQTRGQTALYDSLIMALNETNTQDGVKCIIAFTDGMDNKSRSIPGDVVSLSKKLGIPIYIIGLGGSLENSTLEQLASSTLGEYININDLAELNNIYNGILKKTKEQYVLTYDADEVEENVITSALNIGVNSYKYRGEKFYEYEIKPEEYRVDGKKYDELKTNIKTEANAKFKNIDGRYSLAFKDLAQGDTLSINSEKMIAASTVKIYIMIEAYYRINNGTLNENEIVVLEDSMKVGGSGILNAKPTGERITIKELINLMMVKSDNTAANILIDKLGMDSINERMRALGCINTELNRKMMDQDAIDSGVQNYTSVDDLTLTLTKLYNKQCVNDQYDSIMMDIMKNNETKSKVPNELPSNVEVANKSGEFQGIENDAAIVFTEKGAYILCVTTAEGNSNAQVETISSISKHVYDEYMKSK